MCPGWALMAALTAGAGAVAVSAQSPEGVSVLGRHALAKVDQKSGHGHATYHRWMEAVIGGTLGGLPVVNLTAGFHGRVDPWVCSSWGAWGKTAKCSSLPWRTKLLQITWINGRC